MMIATLESCRPNCHPLKMSNRRLPPPNSGKISFIKRSFGAFGAFIWSEKASERHVPFSRRPKQTVFGREIVIYFRIRDILEICFRASRRLQGEFDFRLNSNLATHPRLNTQRRHLKGVLRPDEAAKPTKTHDARRREPANKPTKGRRRKREAFFPRFYDIKSRHHAHAQDNHAHAHHAHADANMS